MTDFLPDTNVLIDALSGKRGQRELLTSLVERGHRLGCCLVTLAELFSGVRPADLSRVEQFVSVLRWHAATPSIARLAAQWRQQYSRTGVSLALADSLIAATAVECGLTLITSNKKHFPMPELSIHEGAGESPTSS